MSSRASRPLVLGVTGVIAALSLSACGGEQASDPDAATTTSITSSATSPAPTTPAPSPPEGLAKKDWLKSALAATASGIPAFVPAEGPEGFAVTAATFDKQAKTWAMSFTDAAGVQVDLLEAKKPVDALVAAQLGEGATPGDDVDLGDYGTGTWKSWSTAEQAALSLEVKKVTVVVAAPTIEQATVVARTLLTADSASPGPEAG